MSNHWLGYTGTTLVILAYLPQIFHLLKEHCSAGLCVRAYLMWVAASLLLLSYAVSQNDGVFIALQGYQLLSTGIICFFSKDIIYRGFAFVTLFLVTFPYVYVLALVNRFCTPS